MNDTEQALAMLIGRTKAFEYAVGALIMATSDPSKLQRFWTAMLTKIVDTHVQLPGHSIPHYRDGLRDGLAYVTGLIEGIPEQS